MSAKEVIFHQSELDTVQIILGRPVQLMDYIQFTIAIDHGFLAISGLLEGIKEKNKQQLGRAIDWLRDSLSRGAGAANHCSKDQMLQLELAGILASGSLGHEESHMATINTVNQELSLNIQTVLVILATKHNDPTTHELCYLFQPAVMLGNCPENLELLISTGRFEDLFRLLEIIYHPDLEADTVGTLGEQVQAKRIREKNY